MPTDHQSREIHRVNRDGRVARGERTRRAIVHAHANLLREGDMRPTAKLVSARAGISVRTLWLNFGDMEALMSVTARYWLDLDLDLENWTPVAPELPIADRIEVWCTQRGQRMEDLATPAASALLVEPFSLSLTAARREHWARLHHDLTYTFGAEIGTETQPPTPRHLALLGASNSMTWQGLRRDQGLTVDEAVQVMRYTFTGLLVASGTERLP